jgi:hypothetical protein
MVASNVGRDALVRARRLLVAGAMVAALAVGLGVGLGPDRAAAQVSEEVEVIDCAPIVTQHFTGCVDDGQFIRSNGR